jgi:hypothetical protein
VADPTDVIKPFAIKSIATAVRDDIVATAKREYLTTGQLVEKVWHHWKGDGQPLHVGEAAKLSAADVASLMQATAALKGAGLPVPAGMTSLIASSVRVLRGVPPVAPRRKQGQLAPPNHDRVTEAA